MGDLLHFLWLCLEYGFRHSWDAVDILSTILGVLVGIVLWNWGHLMSERRKDFLGHLSYWIIPIGGACTFTAVRLLMSPYFVYKESRAMDALKYTDLQNKYQAIAKASPIKIDVHEADQEVRNKLAETQKELDEEKEKLAKDEDRIHKLASVNPLDKPITVSSATATIQITGTNYEGIIGMGGAAAALGFCVGNKVLLIAYSEEVQRISQNGNNLVFKITANTPVDSPLLGGKVADILTSGYIQIIFPVSIVPNGTRVNGGEVVWAINNEITLRFDIPPQRTDSSNIFIHDLSKGLAPLRSLSRPLSTGNP